MNKDKPRISQKFKIKMKSPVDLERDLITYFEECAKEGSSRSSRLYIKIKEELGRNKAMMFLLFWIPFVQSNESLTSIIFEENPIFIYNNQIKDYNKLEVTARELNNYAFSIALDMKIEDKSLIYFIRQGKIVLPAEWVLDKLRSSSLKIIEEALLYNLDTVCKTKELEDKIKAYYTQEISREGYITTSQQLASTKFLKKNTKSSRRGSVRSSNRSFRKGASVNSETVAKFKKSGIDGIQLKREEKLNFVLLFILADIVKHRCSPFISEEFLAQKSETLVKAITTFDPDKKFSREMLEGLYIINKRNVAIMLLESSLLKVELSIMEVALFYDDYKFALLFFHLNEKNTFFNTESFHFSLVDYLESKINSIEIYLFLVLRTAKFFSLRATKYFTRKMFNLTTILTDQSLILTNCANPIKILVLIAEICRILQRKYPPLEYTIQRIINNCMETAEGVQNSVEEDNLLREIMLEKDLSGRTVLDVISKNNFLALLKNKFVEKIVEDLWNGPYFIQNSSFFECSSNFRALQVPWTSRDYDVFTKSRLSLSNYKDNLVKLNFTPFKVWLKNVTTRFYFELLFWLSILLVYLGLVIGIWREYRDLREEFDVDGETMTLFREVHSNTASVESLSEPHSMMIRSFKAMKDFNYWVKIIEIFLMSLPLGYVSRAIFALKGRFAYWGESVLIEALISLTSLVFLSLEDTIMAICSEIGADPLSDLSILIDKDPLSWVMLKFGALSFLLWMRISVCLKGTQSFGPLIVILILSIKGVTLYIFAFVFINFMFSTLGSILFIRAQSYYTENIMYFFFYMSTVSFGGDIFFRDLTTPEMKENRAFLSYVAIPYYLVFLVINVIVFYNLIIALLSNIYTNLSINSKQLFIQQRLAIKNKYFTEDDRYSSLINCPFPVNLLIAPFSLLFVFTYTRQKAELLNWILNSINYSLYVIFYTLFFLVSNLAMIPFAYLRTIIVKLTQILIEDVQEYFLLFKVFSFLVYIVFGPLLLIFQIFVDQIIFTKQLFRKNVTYIFETEENEKFFVKFETILLLIEITRVKYRKTPLKVTVERFLWIFDKFISNDNFPFEDYFLMYNLSLAQLESVSKDKNDIVVSNLIKSFEDKGINFRSIEEFISCFLDKQGLICPFEMHSILTNRLFQEEMFTFFTQIKDSSFRINKYDKVIKYMRSVEKEIDKQKKRASNYIEKLTKGAALSYLKRQKVEKISQDDVRKFKEDTERRLKKIGSRIQFLNSFSQKKSTFTELDTLKKEDTFNEEEEDKANETNKDLVPKANRLGLVKKELADIPGGNLFKKLVQKNLSKLKSLSANTVKSIGNALKMVRYKTQKSERRGTIFEFKEKGQNIALAMVDDKQMKIESVVDLGKIVTPFLSLVVIPRNKILEFIQTQGGYKAEMTKVVKDNLKRTKQLLNMAKKSTDLPSSEKIALKSVILLKEQSKKALSTFIKSSELTKILKDKLAGGSEKIQRQKKKAHELGRKLVLKKKDTESVETVKV